jgi:2-haloacid dehalogenase
MSSPIKAMLFDFGGVLLDWDPRALYQRFFEHPLEIDRFLEEIDFTAWNANQDKGRPFAQAEAELSTQYPQYAHLISAYFEHYEDSILGPLPGMPELLMRVKQAGYPLYGLSNWSAETFPLIHDKYPFFDLFDDIILSGAVKLLKPDPAIFRLTLDRIKLKPEECLLIDDSPTNLATARDLGFATVHFRSAQQLEQDLYLLDLLQEVQP